MVVFNRFDYIDSHQNNWTESRNYFEKDIINVEKSNRARDYGPGGGWRPLFKEEEYVYEEELPVAKEPILPDEDIKSAFVDCLTCLLEEADREEYKKKLRQFRTEKKNVQAAGCHLALDVDRKAAEAAAQAAMAIEKKRKSALRLELYALDKEYEGLITIQKATSVGAIIAKDGKGSYVRIAEAAEDIPAPRQAKRKCSTDFEKAARSTFYSLDSHGSGHIRKDDFHKELGDFFDLNVLFDTNKNSDITLKELENSLIARAESKRATRALCAAAILLSSKHQLEYTKRNNIHLIFRDQLKKSAQREFFRHNAAPKISTSHQVENNDISLLRQIPARYECATAWEATPPGLRYLELGRKGRIVLEFRLAVSILPQLLEAPSFPSQIDCVLHFSDSVYQIRIPFISRDESKSLEQTTGPLIALRSGALRCTHDDTFFKIYLLESAAGRPLSRAQIDLVHLDSLKTSSNDTLINTIRLISLDVGTSGHECTDHELRIMSKSSASSQTSRSE